MKMNIQTKLFITLAGLTILILGGVLYLVTNTVTKQIEEKVISDFKNTQTIFAQQQRLIYDRLVESSLLIGQNSTFIANVQLKDPATVLFSVEEFSAFAAVDLFTVTDKTGKVLARLHEPELFNDDISNRTTVFIAMNGEVTIEIHEWPELWGVNEFILQVVSEPIFYNDVVIGTLTLGTMFTEKEAKDLKGDSHIDISIFYNDNLVGTTLDETKHEAISNFVTANKTLIDSTVSYLLPSQAFTAVLDGVENFTFISPLGRGERAYYVASVPTSLELQILSAIQDNILTTSIIFFIITLIFALFLGNNFSRPILRLSSGMNEVKAGNLDISVKPSTHDEIGTLTESFNEMVTGLRERLHLSKYVGSHTLEMVQASTSSEVSLGGIRQNLTVLFSDIRGFTSYSENRAPEEVINMLNNFLGFQADIVKEYNGSVDKFVGDEMFALFTGENSTQKAIDCSIAIQKKMIEQNKEFNAPITIGIGINYGPVILGNMGAQDRMDYTALGATVNLGARLCSSAKGGQILIPKELIDELQLNVKTGQLLLIAFKGISEKLKIVEVLGE